ncbi:MAG TPA: glycosyltransferase [Gemmatimonadaceae bacterium]|nr:glycosyltransferase [Gemmatimonadaceae bacterium]
MRDPVVFTIASSRPTVLIYCQHSTGMGHLVRTMALARGLTAHFRVVVMNGGEWPELMDVPDGVEIVALPPIGTASDGALTSLDGAYTLEAAHARRRDLLLATWDATRAHAIVIELFPFGRRKFSSELLPFLEHARATSAPGRAPVVLCSLRDILVRGRHDQREYDDRAATIANRYFDAVLVHADPALARLEESFKPTIPLSVPVHYTGFASCAGDAQIATATRHAAAHATPAAAFHAACSTPHAHAAHVRRMIVSAGGGRVGEPLLTAAVQAHALLTQRRSRTGYDRLTVIGGPFLPEAAWQRVQQLARAVPDVELIREVRDLPAMLRAAAGSVSQCGYNTALEVIQSGVPALVVPYHVAGEDEQMYRARRLEARGAVRVLPPAELTAERLAAALRVLPAFRPRHAVIDLSGVEQTAALVLRMVETAAHPTPGRFELTTNLREECVS